MIRRLEDADYDPLWTIFGEIADAGATYPHDAGIDRDAFRAYWSPGEQWTLLAKESVAGGYTLRPNQPGRGSHVATASFIVGSAFRGRGFGRRLGEHAIARAGALGYAAMQFNLVVGANEAAVNLWTSLGFTIAATLPRRLQPPRPRPRRRPHHVARASVVQE